MKIKIDQQEKLPLDFTVGGSISEVTVTHLPIADYWASWEDGTEMPVIFERKTVADLFGTLTNGMERFKREIAKANENNIKLILIVEGSICDVLAATDYSSTAGKSILKTMFTLWLKYDVLPVFTNNRSEMKRFMTETWESCGRNFKPMEMSKS